MNNLFELALGIKEPWFIKGINFQAERKRLDITIDFKEGSTFFYKNEEDTIGGYFKAYDSEIKEWRHLNFFEHECYLIARIPRVIIGKNRMRLIKAPWEGLCPGFTLLFEALLLQLTSYMPVHQVGGLTKISDYRIWKMLEKYIEKVRAKNDYSGVTAVGLDETSSRKGHKYITLFVDMNDRKTMFITEGKGNETVKEFVKDLEIHEGKNENIKDVSCDMSGAFIKGVHENLPSAEITFDKFHILKIINEAVDEVRRLEAHEESILKSTRYLFLKNKSNLTKEQTGKLEELSMPGMNLKSVRALHMRENFQEIYKAENKEQFEYLLDKWYFWATHSRLMPIREAAKTIKSHWDGVIRWKVSQINNGILEGLNSIIQAAKSKARGFTTLKNFKIIAYLVTGKLNFNLVNYYYSPT